MIAVLLLHYICSENNYILYFYDVTALFTFLDLVKKMAEMHYRTEDANIAKNIVFNLVLLLKNAANPY